MVLVIVAAGAGSAACGGTAAIGGRQPRPRADPPSTSRPTGRLVAPKVPTTEDAAYLKYVTEADPALATYVSDKGNVALQALLTDGSAFCAFLARDGVIDEAMVSLAIGARGVEKSTDLPSSVTTFNTIEASALLTLCPSEQSLLPAGDRQKIRDLGTSLGTRS